MDYRFYTGYEPDGSFFTPPGPGVLPSDRVGLAAFEAIDEISLVAMPDLAHLFRENVEAANVLLPFITAQRDLLKHCAKMGERFALLDPIQNATPAEISEWPQHFPEKELQKFGALYYPWVYATFDTHERPVPPSGLLAGVTAYSDILNGVHKAPANAVVKGAFDLGILVNGEFQTTVVDRELQNDLNPEGVNCLRKFESGAIRIHGARTLNLELESRYVNIRRIVLSVVKELSRNMLWTVFEPNDPTLWKRIETSLTRFFQSMLAKGMTASNRPSEAYFVKCSSETNPDEQVLRGEVVAEVGIALLAPAEFIVLTARRTPGNLRVIEEET
jgi:phage tail sheath protein FI